MRQQVLAAAGLLPQLPRLPLRVQRLGETVRDTFVVERLLFEPFPGLRVGANLYRPRSGPGRYPGVLVAHGHWPNGRVEDLPSYSVPALCANLAAQGYVALSWDMLGYGDTTHVPHSFGRAASEQLWSFGPLGLQLWGGMRALDLLQSLPDVDPTRIGVTGASGGGTQAYLLAAVDDRITAAAPVNMVSAHFQGDSACEGAPGLRVNTNNVEITALIAPRALLLVSATGDWTKNTPLVEYPAIRSVYALYGREEMAGNAHIRAGHNYNRDSREAVYRFFRTHLQQRPGTEPVTERVDHQLRASDLLVGLPPSTQAPDTMRQTLFRVWQQLSAGQAERLPRSVLQQRLAMVLGTDWPEGLDVEQSGDRRQLRPRSGPWLTGEWVQGTGSERAVVVHPAGVEAARRSPEALRLLQRGASVLFLEPLRRRRTAWRERRATIYERTSDAEQVQHVLTALAHVAQSPAKGPVTMVGLERAAWWAIFAAAVAPVPVRVEGDDDRLRGTDEELARVFFVPGLQRMGGLRAAMRILSGGSGA